MGLQISLLGPPQVRREAEPVAFDTRKAMALLAHLALSERPRSREALCELLWPEQEPERARGALRRTLSTLRTSLGEEWLDTTGDSVALRAGEGLELDVRRFRELAGSPEHLEEAVELFRGELLEGFTLRDSPDFDHWQASEADALRRELGTALARAVEQLAERGDYDRALPLARRWLALDPLHEPAHRELIRLLALNGDRAAALSQYRDCVRTLSHELGVAPVEETAALFEQVSEGTLAPPARPRPVPRPPAEAAPDELPLTGREEDLAALAAAHEAAAEHGRLAVVEGEAGIGKTRLLAELAEHAREQGAVVLSARCHDDEAGLPYGPILELLRASLERPGWQAAVPPQRLADASLLLPELGANAVELPRPLSLEGPGAQTRLLEGLASVLGAASAGSQPGLLLVDDVHAADEATLDAIAYLGRRLAQRPLLLAVSWRSEGVPPGHRLRRLAADLSREGTAVIVRLERLDEQQVAMLVQAAAADSGLARQVYLESEGLPLFVAEYLAALRAGEPATEGLPGEVRSLLGARLARLSSVAQQVLGAAAVIGRSFGLDTVREASGRGDEEAVAALEELMGQGIVRELPDAEPAYDFSHQKLRALVYDEISLARRRLLHRRVAGALGRGRAEAALVAQHLMLAGDNEEAAREHRLAAEHAASVLAHADALEHLEAALALGSPDLAGLHERIGDLRTLLGDYRGALAAYETAAAHVREPEALAGIERKLGDVHERRGEWERAESRFMAALEAAPEDERGLRARILADLSLALNRAGGSERAAEPARQARALAEAAGDLRAQAQAHNMLGVLARGGGDLDGARTELERSLALAEELGDPAAQAAALNNLALAERDSERALELTERALELSVAYGDRHREAALHNNLADLHHAAGRPTESMEHLKQAVTIFSEVGGDDAQRLPEVWKLVSW